MSRYPSGITARSVLVTCTVALVAVLVTAVVALPLARSAATRQARDNLAEQSDMVAALMTVRADRPLLAQRVARNLRRSGIRLSLVTDGAADRQWVPQDVAREVTAGHSVTRPVGLGHRQVMLVARPTGDGTGVVLSQRITGALSARTLVRLALALLAGLAAGVVA
ncbi:MAG: two-component sensor histidine kinase, partial [Actinocatenispora sp.]